MKTGSDKVILVTTCLKCTDSMSVLQFNGFYKRQVVKRVVIDIQLKPNTEYVMELKDYMYFDETLIGSTGKVQELFQ